MEYSNGILSGPIDGQARLKVMFPQVEAKSGVVVLHRASSFRGSVVRIEADGVVLRSPSSSAERVFRMTPGAFALNGDTITLIKPKVAAPAAQAITASGSVAVANKSAKVAKASRIWVEGIHDAELVEKVWGDDLRYEGIVVERLDGADHLAGLVDEFGPTAEARLGVLVDHLVEGSKESRIAATVTSPHVLITGTPFVDVWQAIRPQVAGTDAWPVIPKGQDWKTGMCAHFGVNEPGRLWKQLLGRVSSYADLEPEFVGAVERLIDFVTTGE